ncbi:protein shisa-9A isoform X1 [Tachysurus ichikawai]
MPDRLHCFDRHSLLTIYLHLPEQEGTQMHNMSHAHPYPVLSQLAHVYEQQQQQQQQPGKELNKYASLKAVGKAKI